MNQNLIMKSIRTALFALTGGLFFAACEQPAQVTVKVNPNDPGTSISPHLIGAFFEDINYAADGGLYAELVQNRSFEYYEEEGYTTTKPLFAWEQIGASGNLSVEKTKPLNANNSNYLHFDVKDAQGGSFKNAGFDGISVKSDESYSFSMFVRTSSSTSQGIEVSLVNAKGNSIAELELEAPTSEWTKVEGVLKPSETDENSELVIQINGSGDYYFDMISLFPEKTFNGRANGLRMDLAQSIADLSPQFVRFPGGCISHGASLDNAYRWKETVGAVEERTPNFNAWGYHQTYGLGFFEYFQFCEDIGAIPLPVVPVGISCQFRNRQIAPIEDMQLWVDDALDLVEFANGSVDTEWGKLRAEMGHPESFNMEYICLGNEEDFIPEFEVRMKMITDSLRKYYPEIKVIGTSGVAASGYHYDELWDYSEKEKLDAVDEHYYVSPIWMLNNLNRYDDFDRNGPKVFIGEYASRDDRLQNAIAEAAYLTGVEKNADVIQFTCYAPLLTNVNHQQWHPDMIRFDNNNVVKTPSYYVQQLYSQYTGDEYIPSEITYSKTYQPNAKTYFGKVGVGTWHTQAKYDDIKVVSGDKVLMDQTFDENTSEWTSSKGTFVLEEGSYAQTSDEEPAMSIFNLPINETRYTLTLKAMKTGGREGFLIPFAYQGSDKFYWLNIGGWNNSRHAVEVANGGAKAELISKGGSIESNKWYTIKVEVGEKVKCYLDDELLFEIPEQAPPIAASVVKDLDENELIVKLVNSSDEAITADVMIEGLDEQLSADVITLTGASTRLRNKLEEPENVKPVSSTIQVKDLKNYSLPANSFQVISIKR